jgi:hypothetical protein
MPGSSMNTSRHRRVVGQAVFCLPDSDSDWFQGYLFETNSSSSSNNNNKQQQFGLLCETQEIDACLECEAGGYREIRMQVTEFGTTTKQYNIPNIEWTGGDMMRLLVTPTTTSFSSKSSDSSDTSHCLVRMQADTIWTGTDATPRVETIFASLLRNLRRNQDDDNTNNNNNNNATVADLMPNVAVVSGTMELWLPRDQDEVDKLGF